MAGTEPEVRVKLGSIDDSAIDALAKVLAELFTDELLTEAEDEDEN